MSAVLTGALIAGGASLLAGGLNTAVNISQAKKNREFNAQEAQKQREWEEMMSNTAVQRKMADLRASGINPILAYESGGASTPSGAVAQTQYIGQGALPTDFSYLTKEHKQLSALEVMQLSYNGMNDLVSSMRKKDAVPGNSTHGRVERSLYNAYLNVFNNSARSLKGLK